MVKSTNNYANIRKAYYHQLFNNNQTENNPFTQTNTNISINNRKINNFYKISDINSNNFTDLYSVLIT